MASSYFDYSVLKEKCDFSQSHAYVNSNGVCALKNKVKPGWAQNSDLYQTYEKLAALKVSELDADFKRLNIDQLKNVSHFVSSLYTKIDKSRPPSSLALLGIKVYNLFASCFGMKKIEIYDYTNKSKILDISNRIKAHINAKSAPVVKDKVAVDYSRLKVLAEPVPPKVRAKPVLPKVVAESVPEKVADPVPEKVAEPVPEKVADPVPEKVADPVPEKVEEKKKDNWAKLAKKPKLNNKVVAGQASSSTPHVAEPVVSHYDLNALKIAGNYPALLDALKKNYLDEIQAELHRLRESDVLTPALEKTLNANLNYVEKNKGFTADQNKFNREGIKVAVGRALEIKKYFKDKYYVITHSQDTRWVIVTYLIKEMARQMYSKEKIHHFKFLRLPQDKPVPRATFTASSYVDDHRERRALISADAYLFNNNAYESTLHFLSNNVSVVSYGGDYAITNTAESIINQMYPDNKVLARKLHELVIKYVSEIGSSMPVGTLHVFCIPKNKALHGEFASLYRSHPYGVPCNCSHINAQGNEEKIMEMMQDDIEFKCSGGLRPQARIIAPNLKPEEVMIKSFTPIDKAKRHEIKKAMRDIINHGK